MIGNQNWYIILKLFIFTYLFNFIYLYFIIFYLFIFYLLLQALVGHKGSVTSLVVNPQIPSIIVSGSSDGTVQVYIIPKY